MIASTRRRRARSVVLAPALAALVLLGGCDDGADPQSAGGVAGVPPVPPDESEVPATAGPLTGRQMPAATALGEGWTERADPGAGHGDEVHVDGPSTQQRDVDELLDGLTPIGCPEAAVNVSLPRPRFALERTYAGPAGQPGVALVLEFADSSGPATFLDRFEQQMRACPARGAASDGPLTLGYRSVVRAPERVSALRQEQGYDADPNRYLVVAVRDGKRVGLVYLSGVAPGKAAGIGTDLIGAIRQM